MALRERLEADQRDAMRSGHSLRLNTIRMLRSAIQNAEQERRNALSEQLMERKAAAAGVPLGEAGEDVLQFSDAEIAELAEKSALSDREIVDGVLAREIKQRRDSSKQYKQAGRQDLVDTEEAELQVLLAYQPEQLSEVEIEAIVESTISEVGASGPRDMGKVMGRLTGQLRGKADLGLVSQLVQRRLAAGG